jgi:hypothetical protein
LTNGINQLNILERYASSGIQWNKALKSIVKKVDYPNLLREGKLKSRTEIIVEALKDAKGKGVI